MLSWGLTTEKHRCTTLAEDWGQSYKYTSIVLIRATLSVTATVTATSERPGEQVHAPSAGPF